MTFWFTVPYLTAISYLAITGSPIVEALIWPLLTAIINAFLMKRSPEEWEAWALKKPGLAFMVEILRAIGCYPSKILIAIQRYLARRAGEVPNDVVTMETLPPGIQRMLKSPATIACLETEAQNFLSRVGKPPAEGGVASPPSSLP